MLKEEYDFSHVQRGSVLQSPRKTRVTIMLDDNVLEAFRARGDAVGQGYQTLINPALRVAIDPDSAPVTIKALRAALDERFALSA